jgi:hypothetical protein
MARPVWSGSGIATQSWSGGELRVLVVLVTVRQRKAVVERPEGRVWSSCGNARQSSRGYACSGMSRRRVATQGSRGPGGVGLCSSRRVPSTQGSQGWAGNVQAGWVLVGHGGFRQGNAVMDGM